MTYQDIIDVYKTPTKAAAALDYSVATLYLWKKKGIPVKSQIVVQERSGGLLMAEERETMERERYDMLMEAFKECAEKCVSSRNMETLIRETGFDRRHLQQIVKESGVVC